MDWYFLFSPDNMPIGVFRTETAEQSEKLFCRLYRRSMEDMAKDGIYMKKEQDVPYEMWDEIHEKYKKIQDKEAKEKFNREQREKLLQQNAKPKLVVEERVERTCIYLETERFMR